ncbi:MAG TPA: hypothetical protein VJ964_10600 [Balneolaceae bacterium]|nr:hypothetical protein [Balneolaceae bacterium]
MSQELDKLVENFDHISAKAKQEADNEVGDKISSATRLSKSEVKELFPKREDQKKLAELMQIVKSADNHNKKVNAIVKRAEDFGGIVVTLLNKFV